MMRIILYTGKGGVGKTTLAGNLAAYLAKERSKRVLVLDLDFQGTLSSTFREIAGDTTTDFRVNALFAQNAPSTSEDWPDPRPVTLGESVCGYLDSDEELAQLEEQLMIAWAIGVQGEDIRFRLANYLARRTIQENYHAVILDAPPRNTTAEINAIMAASHLIVPSRGDRFSAQAAYRFLFTATDLSPLAPHLRLGAVVETMVKERGREHASLAELVPNDEAELMMQVESLASEVWKRSLNTEFHSHIYTSVVIAEDAGDDWTVLGRPANGPTTMLREACRKIVERLNQQGAQL